MILPPAPPIPRNAAQQQTAYTNASFWSNWYEQLRTLVNDITTNLSGVELSANKDVAGGYAGLNGAGRTTKGVDTTDDLIVDDAAQGLVLKSPNGHYWRAAISNAGAVTWTDLGTTKP
jgi:hypothetical protein